MDKIDKMVVETQADEGVSDKTPFQSVEGFCQVNLEEESLLLPILKVEAMDNFLGNNHISRNMSIVNKSGLGLVDKIREMRFEPIG